MARLLDKVKAMRVLGTTVVLALGAAVAAAAPQRPVFEPQYVDLTSSFETPHTRWAKPYAGGLLRALFIGPRGVMREVIEVAQRLSLDYEAVIVHTRWQLGGDPNQSYQRIIGGLPEDVARRLREKLTRPYDVIVVGNIQWKILPEDVEYEILRRTRDGTGLVLAFVDAPTEHLTAFLERAKPEEGLPIVCSGIPFNGLEALQGCGPSPEAAAKIISLRRFGKGRIALLDFGRATAWTLLTPEVGSTAADRPWLWDYYLSLPIRAILWAARREPKARLAALGILGPDGRPVEDLAAVTPNRSRVVVSWQVEAPLGNLGVAYRLRGPDGETLAAAECPIKPTGGSVSASWPVSATIQRCHFADFWLKDGEATVDWASLAFTPSGQCSIKTLSLARESIGVDESCQVKVALSAPAPAGATLRAKAFDAYGRLVAEASTALAPNTTETTVTLPTRHLLGNALHVRCSLFAGGQEVDRDWVWQPVRAPYPRDEFSFLVWAGPGDEFIPYYVGRVLASAGVDTINHGAGLILARHGFRGVPGIRAGLHLSECSVTNHKRTPCFNDPAHRAAVRERLLAVARDHARFGATAYTLGDDNVLAYEDVCWCDFCNADFRRYLQDIYGSLQALNAEWGTQYQSWEQVGPILLEDALRQGREAQWADHRMHMESVWADFHGFARDVVREVDPNARVGSDAACGTGSFGGYDWWKLSKVLGLWNVYPDPVQVEAMRCFHAPGTYTGIWYGGYLEQRYEAYERWAPWYSLFHQLSAAWWFQSFAHASEQCQELAVAPDLTLFEPFVITSQEIAQIKAGVGKLLLAANRDHDGIAVLYSQASLHASTLDPIMGTAEAARRAWVDLLEDVGLQYDFLASEQVEGGALMKGGYRVLILPACFALSDEEINAISAFAQAGGAVIADVRPGIRDAHCKRTDSAPRRDLFGVTYSAEGGPAPRTHRSGTLTVAGRSIPFTLRNVAPDTAAQPVPGIVVAGGDQPPCLLTRRHGAGLVAVLNFPIEPYAKASPETAWLRDFLGPLLRAMGAKPAAEISTRPGEPMDLEIISFTEGPARYLGLTRWFWANRPVQTFTVTLPESYHVYDSRAGKYLGRRQSFEVALAQGHSALFSLLPYRVQSLTIAAEPARRGDLLKAKVTLKTSGPRARHVIHVELADPSGKYVPHYAQNVALAPTAAAASIAIPLALNDPAGRWRLTARDVATGTTASATVGVR